MGVLNDNGAGRRMRRNAVDMAMGLGALTVRQSTVEFTGKAQRGPIATKVNINTIFESLSLHIIGGFRGKPSIVV